MKRTTFCTFVLTVLALVLAVCGVAACCIAESLEQVIVGGIVLLASAALFWEIKIMKED